MIPASTTAATRTSTRRDGVEPAALDAQHCLYFLPLPHGQGSFRPILAILLLAGGNRDSIATAVSPGANPIDRVRLR